MGQGAVCLLLAFAPAAWACPGCTERRGRKGTEAAGLRAEQEPDVRVGAQNAQGNSQRSAVPFPPRRSCDIRVSGYALTKWMSCAGLPGESRSNRTLLPPLNLVRSIRSSSRQSKKISSPRSVVMNPIFAESTMARIVPFKTYLLRWLNCGHALRCESQSLLWHPGRPAGHRHEEIGAAGQLRQDSHEPARSASRNVYYLTMPARTPKSSRTAKLRSGDAVPRRRSRGVNH